MMRQATAADLELVAGIQRDAYVSYEPIMGYMPALVTEDYGPAIAAGRVWLIDDRAVLIIEWHPTHALIYSLGVQPGNQGRGLGRALLDAADRMALGWGHSEIRLYTNAQMTRNQRIYAAHGYRETGRRPHATQEGSVVVDMAKPLRTAETEMRRLLDVMARLRAPDGCAWDRAQDFDSIAPYTIEEAYEVADAIARRDWAGLPDELGDLLFQVVYHARMAEEAGRFGFADVAREITGKMIRRHPHVFAGEVAEPGFWERQKAAERVGRRQSGVLSGVAVALPALTRAAKVSARAARVGFDWPDAATVVAKLAEETAELQAELPGGDRDRVADELGDMLFVMANLARKLDVDPEACLQRATEKFTRRFQGVEALLAAEGLAPADAGLEAMEAAWQRVKASELAAVPAVP